MPGMVMFVAKHTRIETPTQHFAHTAESRRRILVILLALLLLTFDIEPFEEEYEESHGKPVSTGSAISRPASTWETCDKDNAPTAFTFTAIVVIACVSTVPPEFRLAPHPQALPPPVRDKSPPLFG